MVATGYTAAASTADSAARSSGFRISADHLEESPNDREPGSLLDRCTISPTGPDTFSTAPSQFTVAADAGIGIEADWVSVTVWLIDGNEPSSPRAIRVKVHCTVTVT